MTSCGEWLKPKRRSGRRSLEFCQNVQRSSRDGSAKRRWCDSASAAGASGGMLARPATRVTVGQLSLMGMPAAATIAVRHRLRLAGDQTADVLGGVPPQSPAREDQWLKQWILALRPPWAAPPALARRPRERCPPWVSPCAPSAGTWAPPSSSCGRTCRLCFSWPSQTAAPSTTGSSRASFSGITPAAGGYASTGPRWHWS
mmetsp:Transcript_59537/g.159512  ORF Transcript_59537/g.159512 Transcript_59537/m.159512 type:complete len:201 (-) Transcript_59537:758-1360(-)